MTALAVTRLLLPSRTERRLVSELVGLGVREDLVRRAIVMMVNQTNEMEYIHERRQLRRTN